MTVDIIDDEFIKETSPIIAAIIEAKNVVSNGISFSDETIDIISKQIERKKMMVKKLEAIVEKIKTLNNINKTILSSLEELQSQINNIFKNGEDGNHIFQNSNTLDNTIVSIDPKIDLRNPFSDRISGMNNNLNIGDTQQQGIFKTVSAQLDENPGLKMNENRFIFEGIEYHITPKQKKVLLELSKGSDWTTAKKLSDLTSESAGYICSTLTRLRVKGYPIINYISSGKQYWMFEKGKNGNNLPENKSVLILNTLRQYKENNGRSPTATEISDQLKWDIFYVENELKNLRLSGKVNMEKIRIDRNKKKVWAVEEGK